MLSPDKIEKLASRKNVRAIAVRNFLSTLGTMSATDAYSNLRADARSYGWNAPTVNAIAQGIKLASGV